MELVVEWKRLWLVEIIVVRQQWHVGVVNRLRENVEILVMTLVVVVGGVEFLELRRNKRSRRFWGVKKSGKDELHQTPIKITQFTTYLSAFILFISGE